ncbi:hypothetical protein [Sphingopyxis terrae]|uniref:hypothetical protein n=1 Tax=Sphingopyxis terrae TaxID=33052 RepID=UPI0007888FE8|nr:hypothetical protein [Sphingopyxis terrae]
MARNFPAHAFETRGVPAILIDAARCWREARDNGRSVQPCLSRTLDRHECAILAPVLDSLCLFYEAALGRPMAVGEALTLSDDEHLLLGLVNGSIPRQCLNCPRRRAATLDCALCSARIMVALTLGQPASGTLQ